MKKLYKWSIAHPRSVIWITSAITIVIAVLAAIPSIYSNPPSFLHPLTIDTDPENMLPQDEPVRVFHNKMKRRFNLHDMIVVGVINEEDPDGVFNPESLRNIYS
ncbi:MAG: RND transporter, partial [Candidatus Dadabacteria bacterium]